MIFKPRLLLVAALDVLAIASSVVASYALRFEGVIPSSHVSGLPWVVLAFVLAQLASLVAFRLYQQVWVYASLPELFNIVKATGVGVLVLWLVDLVYQPLSIPRSIFLIEWLLSAVAIGGLRVLLRFWGQKKKLSSKGGSSEKRLLIVGAGDAGAMVAREVQHSTDWSIVGFIDDDPNKWGHKIYGIPILGGRERIPEAVRRLEVSAVLIAMPSVSRQVIREIVEICRIVKVPIKILPALYELIDGRVRFSDIREIRIEDLLGREPVKVDIAGISAYIRGKRVLVTGAGGTIGSEICRQVAQFEPAQLIMLGRGEYSLVSAARNLMQQFPRLSIVHLVADIRDRNGLMQIFEAYRPHIVFHAAAHKHVPEMENNPREAVTNNVLGTLNVFDACAATGVERCVFISTDKAANPVSVMGASKRIGELLVSVSTQGELSEVSQRVRSALVKEEIPKPQDEGGGNFPIFVAVRFGNVLGSRGSVVEIFREALAKGLDLEVTHPEMRRYFMTVSEAVALVIQAGALGKGGEIFVLDMGEPVKVVELARNMVQLAGLEPDVDVKIRFTSPRPGEKLTEELIGENEKVRSTEHPKILQIESLEVEAGSFASKLVKLIERMDCASQKELRAAILEAAAVVSQAPVNVDKKS